MKQHRWRRPAFLVVLTLTLILGVQTFVAQAFVIPSGSMERTLHGCPGCVDDRVLVDKLVYRFQSPQPGDVIVFHAPDDGWKENLPPGEDALIKRVVAVGGQTVRCCDAGRVVVDGQPLDEPYLLAGAGQDRHSFGPVTVPEGYLWVMGDNRDDSADSRYHQYGPGKGAVPVEEVVGKARLVIWPPGRWQPVRGAADR
ncbi:signal peptidase I [Amycolatopsis sp. CA-230715]|uniref:signal peptidase I n=1 Tax=Amycolatopsis sp. CA-230715 TaxID=2745196 RepID=UPI0020B2A8CC|nr:signal peptidase I [Amycolatopsis sp. CA-230715]